MWNEFLLLENRNCSLGRPSFLADTWLSLYKCTLFSVSSLHINSRSSQSQYRLFVALHPTKAQRELFAMVGVPNVWSSAIILEYGDDHDGQRYVQGLRLSTRGTEVCLTNSLCII